MYSGIRDGNGAGIQITQLDPSPLLIERFERAPGLSFGTDGKSSNIAMDLQFEKRLEAVKRSALEQKKSDESEKYGAIDYDAPVESDPSTIGLGTKIGIGAAIVVFGVVFALGDFLPTGRPKVKVFSGNSDFGFTAQAMVDEPFKPVSGIKVASWPVVLLPGMVGFQEQIEATL
ncbi:tetratricopeptide repeat (TPR)-like superfamily protein [Actinidia rufa]|uniref:Tetratricopeptide repeat (TPR)-like superfamily protein n=1 Tax=Actinidia rufa TaxID=165716 RepID=A0A7J0GLJ7_9ERIC|nr:tetratricopeptide repeat (TPR)-like superfamily protein [Actinidia rufa]